MKKIVTLKLDGILERGFLANLTIAEAGKHSFVDLNNSLPSNLNLLQSYQQWQTIYRSLDGMTRIAAVPGSPTNISKKACEEAAINFKNRFNQWLLSDSFRDIRDKCIEQFSLPSEEIRVIVRTNCPTLQRFPWHQWDLIERYDKVEIAISSPNAQYQGEGKINERKDKVRILGILGDSNGIDVQKDRKTLEQLKGAKVTFLVEPKQQEINEYLWEQSWDILFFAGHSQTREQSGRIYINATESLTIEDLKYGLSQAIKHGLQLAIFNSCDGLGLAWELQELHIPQVIVMGEPVPDLVAQAFLKHFLKGFSSGQSLYLSVKQARKKVHGDGLENQYPCASWLPTIVQNTSVMPPTWYFLQYGNLKEQDRRIAYKSLIASVIITVLTIGVRSLGLLQGWELNAYDQFMRLKPDKGQDSRLLVVEITEKDIQYQIQKGMKIQGSLSDTALAQLLETLSSYHPRAIGLDIYRDYPITDDAADLETQYQNPNFFAVCKGSNSTENTSGIAPPKKVSSDRIGFIDVPYDDDEVVRRYLWWADFDSYSLCSANISFGLQLALHYFQAANIPIEKKVEGDKTHLQIGNATLRFLEFPSGGYQRKIDDDSGYQILLNYRTPGNIARSVTLTDVLEGRINPKWIEGKIVLIGVTNIQSPKDAFSTPFSQNSQQKMYGVYIHAQMIGQLLSAVLDGESMLSLWHPWVDGIWILGWAIVGGLLAWKLRQLKYLLPATSAVVIIIVGVCFIIFIQGWWIPFIPSEFAFLGTAGVVAASRCKFA